MHPKRTTRRFKSNSALTAVREELELRWRERMIEAPRFATMFTAQSAAREPFHRWLHFKQGFSPGLVRTFLQENDIVARSRRGSVLDLFSGSGTCVVECARQKVPALGNEALPALAFLTNCAFERNPPPLPEVDADAPWESAASQFIHPLHRAALMLAVWRQHTTSGTINRGAKPLCVLLKDVYQMIQEDLQFPLALKNSCEVGDARNLQSIADQTIGSILTSPPYLSRHDYNRIMKPVQAVHSFWFGDADGMRKAAQLPGHVNASTFHDEPAEHPAVEEAATEIRLLSQIKSAHMVRAYFQGMKRFVAECARVLVHGAPLWIVLGGARIEDVYIPSDLIVAEMLEDVGFKVREVRVGRDLVGSRRKFGAAGHVAPRESILIATSSS